MKKSIKRILSLVLALVLICSALPAQALAQETGTPRQSAAIHTEQTDVHLNPLYEGLVDEDLILSRQPAAPDVGTASTSGTEYVDEAGAVELLRAAMVSRLETVVIPIATADTDHNAQMKRIFQAALNHTGNPVEGDYLMWQYGSWHAGSKGYEDAGIRYYTTTFTLTYYTDAAQEAVVDTAVEALLTSLDLDGGTDYEKIKGIYDYICANVTYDYDNLNDTTYTLKHSAYAALIDGTAVCQGYALLMYRLALELGVDCRLVAGLGGGEAHGWNIIRLGDLYYNADATWDAGKTAYTCFLVSEDNFPNHIRGNYTVSNGMDYTGEAFRAAYPMGTENYIPSIPEMVASGTCGEDLTWELDDAGRLTVSGTGAMTDFTSTGQPWRDWKQDIRSVVIGEGVTSIGDYAFFHCYSLANVKLPDTVARIGSSAFFYCSVLPEVDLPANLQTIDDYAFGSCKALSGMDFPAGLKTIGVTAFSGTELTSAVLPEGITSIGKQAFLGCPLTEAVIPASLESIGYCAFQDCAPLDYIAVDENNPIYCNDSQGAMYTKDMGTLIVVPGGYAGEFVIPDSVTAVTGCALRNCDLLTGVTIPETVSEIGELAFYDSAALESVVWPAAATKVPRSAFSGCTGLSSIELPEGVTLLDQSAFYGCTSLKAVTVPASVTELGSLCFGKAGLQNITFLGAPPAFTNANTFTGVTAEACYPSSNANWTEEVRQQYGGTITWTAVPADCTHRYEAGVTEPTCTEIGYTTYTCTVCGDSFDADYTDSLGHDYADGSCNRCGEADPGYVPPVAFSGTCGENVFWKFDEATGTLTIYGEGAMEDYTGHNEPWRNHYSKITSLVVESGVTNIGDCSFTGYQNLAEVKLPEGLLRIGAHAFDGCTGLKQITLPESLTEIGEMAFCYCGLTSITIPAKVEIFGPKTFWQCLWMTEITFAGDAPALQEKDVFLFVTATAYYPENNGTWTEEVRESFGGEITWVPYGKAADVIRLSGKDRYQTAFAVANQLKENLGVDLFQAVVVAYGQNFPDALTGSYLAAVKDAPILLTEPSVDTSVLEYIEANLVPGGKVYILGGTAAVSENFENIARVMGFDVQRLKGAGRYETNLAILKEAGVNATDEVLIATGTNYADSLSASATGLPMLLVGDTLTDAQKEFLATTSKDFVILGGTGAVSAEVEAELAAIGTVVRVKGTNRYGTSVAIAERYFSNPKAAVLAYAQGFPDGLCGGPLAISIGAPLILTSNENPTAADSYVENITIGAVTGGTGRISDETVRAIFDLAADVEISKK